MEVVIVFGYINKWQILMEPHGAEAVGHPGLFSGFPINIGLDYKGKGTLSKLESSHSQQHNSHHHVSVGDSFQF